MSLLLGSTFSWNTLEKPPQERIWVGNSCKTRYVWWKPTLQRIEESSTGKTRPLDLKERAFQKIAESVTSLFYVYWVLDCVGSCPTNYTVCLDGVEIAWFLLNVHLVEQLSGIFLVVWNGTCRIFWGHLEIQANINPVFLEGIKRYRKSRWKMTDAWFFSNQWCPSSFFFRDAVRWAIDDGIEFEVQTGYCFDAGNGPPILYPCHEPKAQRKQRFQIVDPQLAFNSAGERWEFIVYLDAWVWGVVRKNHKPDLLNMFFSLFSKSAFLA